MTKLLPCPHCGSEAEINGSVESSYGMAIICPKCAGRRYFAEDLAIERWNERTFLKDVLEIFKLYCEEFKNIEDCPTFDDWIKGLMV
jgi:excinuclease UvrABC ATPase subunit